MHDPQVYSDYIGRPDVAYLGNWAKSGETYALYVLNIHANGTPELSCSVGAHYGYSADAYISGDFSAADGPIGPEPILIAIIRAFQKGILTTTTGASS